MPDKNAVTTLKRVRLDLARDPDHPDGSSACGYDFIAPIDENGHIIAVDWKKARDRCRVKRYWTGEGEMVGHIVHKPGGAWAFHYDIHGPADSDETGYRFGTHVFKPGEYVSIKEHDGVMRTFRVRSVVDTD